MARIGFSSSKYLPTVRIQPRAEYLHAIGPEAMVASLQETLGPQLGQLRFGVSRVDLFSDWQGWSLSLDEAHHFVCRADARRTYELGGILTGWSSDPARPRPSPPASTTRRLKSRPRGTAGGPNSGVTGTKRACRSTAWSSRSNARD
jgi:hypothetical protein